MMGKVWAVLMSRGPARGTWAHLFGSMGSALVLGLAFWFVRANT
jgi:hypothetical protein